MDPIEQFLQDSYKKYKNRFLTPDELSNIKSTYGSDSKLLVTDVLKKFNKPYDDNTVNKITSTYGLSTQASTATPATQSSSSGAIDHGKVKNVIRKLESDNNYGLINIPRKGEKPTSATGAFQHMWSDHGSQIAQVTGITSQAEYLKNPEAQEKYQDYLQPMYEKQLPKLRRIAIEQGTDYSDEELMYLIHHSWVDNAEKFLKGDTTVPDYIGLKNRLDYSRKQGLTTPRNVTNKLIAENTDFVSVNGVLPTRGGKEFKSPVDKRMVDKLTGFMEDHGLVVTDTNDSKIHKSKAQQTGKSLDVNFDDKSINPDKVKAAVLDGQRRGLRLVYEIKDKRVYDQFIKTRPDLKDHVAHIPAATGNHFSVYHADNYNPDANLLTSSKIIPKERLQEINVIKSKVIGAAKRAANKEALEQLGKLPTLKDVTNPLAMLLGPGAFPIYNAGKKLFSEEEQYSKALAEMFTTGLLNASDFTNEELVELANAKTEIVDMEKQSKIARQRVKDQLADKGILEGVGDFFAGTPLDKLLGIGSADRLDTKDGKININYKNIDKNDFFDNTSKYLSPEEILNLTAHPEAKDPKNPNDPKNKALRGIQKILIAGDSLEFDAKTKADTLRREFAGNRLQTLEKEIIKVGGKDALTTLSTLSKKYEDGSITEEESQQLQALQQKLENSGGLLTQYGQNVEQYNTSNEAIKSLQGKYGIVTKLRLRDDEYQKQADAYDKKLGFWGKKERSVSNFLSAFSNGILDMPGAVVNLAGLAVEATTGLDVGANDAAKARNRSKVDYIASTDRKRDVLETTMNVDGYEVVFENNKAAAVYDSKGYKVEDSIAETVGKKAQEKLNTDYEGKQSNLDWLDNTSFNFSALQQAVEDTAPQLLEIILTGNVMKAGAMAATKTLAKTATSGSKVANAARILSKPLQSARGVESAAMVPVFVKDTVDGAINDGAITSSQIFGTAAVKLGMEAIAESMFAGPIGKMLSNKGITQKVFSKGLSEKLNDVVKYYASGKITSRDFINQLGRASKELLEDVGGEFVEEAFIEWSNGAVNEFLNSQLGTNYDEETASAKEVFSAGLIGLAAGGAMSGPRAVASIVDYKSNIADSYKNLLSDVIGKTSASLAKGETIANPEAFKNYLSQAVEDGQISQKDADKYSAAIQSAADRTKFTNDIDISTGTFKDLRDARGLEARENFINLVRNTAFNKSLTEAIDTTNQFAKEEQSAKVQQYENIIKELELNAHKAVYSSSTPTIIGLKRGLNPSQISELRNKQVGILEEVNATKLNAVNKAKAVELKLNDAANTILKSKENISDKEKAKLEEIDKQIKTVTEDLNKTNTEEAAKAAVSANTATPEQVQAELTKAKQSVDDLFTGQKTLKDNELPDFSIDLVQQLLENTPDMLKGEVAEYIDKKLEAINAQAYRQQVQNFNQQEKTAKPTNSTKLSPDVAFDTRYNGNTELENTEWESFKEAYIRELDKQMNVYDNVGDVNGVMSTLDTIKNIESAVSFKDTYINDAAFREFVDANTNVIASKPNTTITKDKKQEEEDKKAKKEAKKQQEISKKQENIKDIAKNKELYEAAKVIVEKQYASQAFLVKELGITNEKAKELLQTLEDNGIIGPHVVGKTREIYIKSIEEFNNLVQSTLQSVNIKEVDLPQGKVGNTNYEIKGDYVYFEGKKLDNPENKTHKQLIEDDIERRRQEELKNRVIYDRFPTVADGEFKIIGDPNNRIFRINENTGRPQVLDESNGLWSNTEEPPNMFFEITKRSGFQKSKDKINAKYDAELAAFDKKADIERRRKENPSVERGVLINYESGKTKEQLIDIVSKLKEGRITFDEIYEEFSNLPTNTLLEVAKAFNEGTLADKIQFGLDVNELSEVQSKTRRKEEVIKLRQKALSEKQKAETALKDSEYKIVKKKERITGKVTETKVKRTVEEKAKYEDFYRKIIEDINKQIEEYDAELKALEQSTSTNQSESNPALRDVESTAKALEGKNTALIQAPLLDKIAGNAVIGKSAKETIAEEYHKAKADGSNPELVKAVESLLSKEQPTPTTQSEIEAKKADIERRRPEIVNRYTNEDVKANPDKIYVFGDNTQRIGTGGQAQIRNNKNAFGIATKIKPNNNADAFMSDKDLEANKKVIDSDIQKILAQNKPLVFPKDGFGTGLAKLKEKAPKTYEYLKQRLAEEFYFDNDKGEINAKYDAELKALEQQSTTSNQSEIEAKKAEIKRRSQEDPTLQRGVLINFESGKTISQLSDIVSKLRSGSITYDEIVKVFLSLPINTLMEVKSAFNDNTLADKIQFGIDAKSISDLEDSQPKKSKNEIVKKRENAILEKRKSEDALKNSEYKTIKKTDPITRDVTETKVKRTDEEKSKYEDFHKGIIQKLNEDIAKYDAELKVLEQPTPTTQSNIEAKKADIERIKQEKQSSKSIGVARLPIIQTFKNKNVKEVVKNLPIGTIFTTEQEGRDNTGEGFITKNRDSFIKISDDEIESIDNGSVYSIKDPTSFKKNRDIYIHEGSLKTQTQFDTEIAQKQTELKASEQPTPTTQSEIEAKKADVEEQVAQTPKQEVLEKIKPISPVQEEKTPIISGKIPVSANGFGALSIADNLLVTDYLKAGDPVFYELSAKSTDEKPIIEKVAYYKDKSFGQPVKGAKRIILQEGFGKDEHKLTERFANEIKAGKERIETKATYVKLNKTKELTPDNKKQLSLEEIETIRPYLYVVGKSFNSNDNIILLNSEHDGENFLSISDFISDLKEKNPSLKNFQEVENILRRDDVNGKVVFVKGNTIIPLDTITNKEYEPNKEFITEFLDRLSSEATGMADWRLDIDGRFLADAVKKRSDVKDYTNETSPNFRGRLVEYFASGPQHRQANPTELLYKIKYNEEEGKSEPIYLTKEQALEELLNIRVNVNHEELRAENSEGLNNILADVIRVPAMPKEGFADLYNVVGLEDVNSGTVSNNTIKLQSEEVITPKEKETTNKTTIENIKSDEPIARKGSRKRDFKISSTDYTGKVEKAVSYLKTRFEEIGVEVNDEVLRNLVKGTAAEGSKVWGAFHNAMVTLSSLSGEKIARHESMHVVFKMFLNKQQQIDILNELWSKHKDDPRYKGKEEQFKKEMQEFLTSDTFDTKQDFKLTDQEQVNFSLKAVNILQSDKAKQVFEKGNKNNWTLDRILSELQVPKEQKQLVENIYNNRINDILKTLEKNCE